jgi:membrane protease YdiL (CAAX protease family)
VLSHAILLAAVLGLLAWFVRNDRAEYAAFKLLTRTEDRQRVFRRWTFRSFLFFVGAALAALALVGRLGALASFPAEFESVSALLRGFVGGDLGGGFPLAMICAMIAGAVGGTLLQSRLRARKGGPPKLLGDVEPLFPRNREERRWTALMAINAGPAEELFFRLMLPLLIALVTGSAAFAFMAAGLIFGLVHFYQGWTGIVATTLAGFVFAALYLATEIIWVPVVAHSLMNLNSLWLRPLLDERRSRTDAGPPDM